MAFNKKTKIEIYKIISESNCNIKKLCLLMNISRNTYYKWLKKYDNLTEYVEEARKKYIKEKHADVVNALYKKALGFHATEIRTTTVDKIADEKIMHYKKYFPPCHKSIKYILDNFDEDGAKIKPNISIEESSRFYDYLSEIDELKNFFDDENSSNKNIEETTIETENINEETDADEKPKIEIENINEETDDDEKPKIEIENIVDEYSKLREAVALVLPLYRVHKV